MSTRSPHLPRRWLGAAGSILIVTLAGCGGSHASTAPTTTASSAPPSSSSSTGAPTGPPDTTAAPATSSTVAPSGPNLSGHWSGRYSGTFTGTFDLTWHQSGTSLAGTITISSLNDGGTAINGSVQGSSIRFGTVGSQAITYTGSVTGSSMSGSWQIAAGGQSHGGGSWSASRS